MTGTVPAELGNLAPDHDRGYRGLEGLDLSKNELTGDIPRELTRLQGEINLWGNPITGCLPDEWEARVRVELYPCSRGANDNPDGWLKLVAGKDEYGNDLYPEPIIVSEIRQQILTGLMPHLVEWARAEHPDSAGHYSEDGLRTIIYSRLQHELNWEPLWSQAPDLKIRINGQFEWDAREGPVQYQMTAVGVLDTVETSKRDWTQEYIEHYERVPAFSRVEGTPKTREGQPIGPRLSLVANAPLPPIRKIGNITKLTGRHRQLGGRFRFRHQVPRISGGRATRTGVDVPRRSLADRRNSAVPGGLGRVPFSEKTGTVSVISPFRRCSTTPKPAGVHRVPRATRPGGGQWHAARHRRLARCSEDPMKHETHGITAIFLRCDDENVLNEAREILRRYAEGRPPRRRTHLQRAATTIDPTRRPGRMTQRPTTPTKPAHAPR